MSVKDPLKKIVAHLLRSKALARVNRAQLLRYARKADFSKNPLQRLKVGQRVYVLSSREAKKCKVGMFVKPTTNRRELWDTDRVYVIIKRTNNTNNDTPTSVGPLYTYAIRDISTDVVKKGRYYREELHPVDRKSNSGGDKRYLKEFIEKEKDGHV